MSETDADILVDIPDEDLPKLAKLYEEHKDWAPQAYSTITSGIEWKKTSNGRYMTFMSPKGSWQEDGTFFVVLEYNSYDIFIFTLDDAGKNVYEALMTTRRLKTDYTDRPRLLFCIRNELYTTVVTAIKDKKIEILMEIPCYLYAISKDEALQFDTECPDEVYIKQLEKSDAIVPNSLWPHRYKNSEKYIELLIEMNGAYGVFLKSTNELVSWAILSMMGQLSLVQTADEHKKKGYASLVTKHLSKELAKKGHNALGTILVENIISQMMFEKIGFKSLGLCTYTLFR